MCQRPISGLLHISLISASLTPDVAQHQSDIWQIYNVWPMITQFVTDMLMATVLLANPVGFSRQR